MKAVQRACKDTPGSDETLDGTLKEFESLHADVSVGIRQFTNSFALLKIWLNHIPFISNEYNDFSQYYAQDLIKPFEEKLHQDTSYLEDQLRTFKTKFGENFKLLEEKEEKLEKMNKNRGKNKKEDKKRMELQTEIAQRREALEVYTKEKLKKSVTEQRQRYV